MYLQSWYASMQRVIQVKRSPSCIRKQILWRRREKGWNTYYCVPRRNYQPKGSGDPFSVYTFGTTCNGGPEGASPHHISSRTLSLSIRQFLLDLVNLMLLCTISIFPSLFLSNILLLWVISIELDLVAGELIFLLIAVCYGGRVSVSWWSADCSEVADDEKE